MPAISDSLGCRNKRVVTPGYKKTPSATILVTGQHSHTFFLLSPTRDQRRIRFGSMFSLKLEQGVKLRPKLFPGPIADHFIPLGVNIQHSPVDLTYLDPPCRLRILRTFFLARWAGFLETMWA